MITAQPIKVFITDDHEVVLDGLRTLLGDHPDIELVGTALNGKELLEKLDSIKQGKSDSKFPDVILMDINMPVMDGFEATQRIKSAYPEVKILALTMADNKKAFRKIMNLGADGFASKSKGKKDIILGIKKVFENKFIAYADLEEPDLETDKPTASFNLTLREKEIIYLITKEFSLTEIAEKLSLSESVVSVYRKNILNKLQVKSDVGITREAIEKNLTEGINFD